MLPYAYVIPLRNDLEGMLLQVLDLVPNRSTRSVLDPSGQTFYVGKGMDQPGPTRTAQGLYVGGSRTTSPLPALVGFDYLNRGKADAQGPSDVSYGLTAYLLDAVCVDPAGVERVLSSAEATAAVQAILKAVAGKAQLDLKSLTQMVSTAVGTQVEIAGGPRSFGSVREVLRLLSGEAYGLPAGTPLVDPATGKRFTLTERANLLSQIPSVLAPAQTGRFLTIGDGGYRAGCGLMLTEALLASIKEGRLKALLPGQAFVLKNPTYAYTDTQASQIYPRALWIDGTPVPPSGETSGVLMVYAEEGAIL